MNTTRLLRILPILAAALLLPASDADAKPKGRTRLHYSFDSCGGSAVGVSYTRRSGNFSYGFTYATPVRTNYSYCSTPTYYYHRAPDCGPRRVRHSRPVQYVAVYSEPSYAYTTTAAYHADPYYYRPVEDSPRVATYYEYNSRGGSSVGIGLEIPITSGSANRAPRGSDFIRQNAITPTRSRGADRRGNDRTWVPGHWESDGSQGRKWIAPRWEYN